MLAMATPLHSTINLAFLSMEVLLPLPKIPSSETWLVEYRLRIMVTTACSRPF